MSANPGIPELRWPIARNLQVRVRTLFHQAHPEESSPEVLARAFDELVWAIEALESMACLAADQKNELLNECETQKQMSQQYHELFAEAPTAYLAQGSMARSGRQTAPRISRGPGRAVRSNGAAAGVAEFPGHPRSAV